MAGTANPYPPIADHAIIGNMHTAALISSNGSLDWCCFPRFDSPAVFCKLLDARKGGEFCIKPIGNHTVSRSYVDATNVLCATYSQAGGKYRLTDFMPVQCPDKPVEQSEVTSQILRRIEGISGQCEIEVEFRPTFDFVRTPTRLTLLPGKVVAQGAFGVLVLHSTAHFQLSPQGDAAYAHIQINAGERLDFRLVYTRAEEKQSDEHADTDFDHSLADTLAYWRQWASRCTYQGPYRHLVQRSALVLKLLTYEPTGAIVAAPTTSLPEEMGGVRNWDYRYTWIRDSALVLHALMSIGYHPESMAFFNWIESLCIKCCGQLQIMYMVDGGTDLHEVTLSHLEGYQASSPVRTGNAAAQQKQLDIYGELLDAFLFCYENMQMPPPGEKLWESLRFVADQAAAKWHEPDEGIWEVRSASRHYLYSKLQCWVALDRAIRLAEHGRLPADLKHWRNTCEAIRAAIISEGYDDELGAFVQAFGIKSLDASALAIPLVGFLPAEDQRVQSTVEKIKNDLTSGGLVYRYLSEDGVPGGEGIFALCTFWLIDNLLLLGRVEEARHLFEKVASHANDLGLFSEEFDPITGEMLGNFPQGFTHLALIRSAVNLVKAGG